MLGLILLWFTSRPYLPDSLVASILNDINEYIMKYHVGGFYDLPILFSKVVEIIHVTPFARIQRVLCLQIFSSSDVDQLSRVFHHKVSLGETFHSLEGEESDDEDS